MTDESQAQSDKLPPMNRDRAFWGMTATQFLGAFNDNLFKQMVLLICVDYALKQQANGGGYQAMAQGLFALPFVLFSGFAGFLSDRMSKRTIIVSCKVAEIFVMAAGVAAFLSGEIGTTVLLTAIFAVLFFMGTQSAYFGPSKYGILPEMFRSQDLPRVNGMIQMTTFLAIIFGTAAAGYSKDYAESLEGFEFWHVSAICVVIAVLGTATSLLVRRTPVAHPGLQFDISAIAIKRETWQMLRGDRQLLGVLLISSLFWFLGGLVLPAVNAFGKIQMGYNDTRTSLLATCMGIGIALGCLLAGQLSRKQIRFGLVTVGAWGLLLGFAAMAWLGSSDLSATKVEWLARLFLMTLGLSAGLFTVPLQVFMQVRPPEDQKGRMIGAMNLVNWIGILLSAGFYFGCTAILSRFELPGSWTFAAAGLVILPVAIFYRPHDGELG